MATRREQQKWLPPDFDPEQHGTINGYHGSHHLRERAKNLHLGILVIRFQMPFNVWCLHCDKHIAMGVRFNANKKKVGMYYTTPIYEFQMGCHLCGGELVIRTDPQNTEYVCLRGLRRKVEKWEPSPEETGQLHIPTDEEKQKLAEDAFFKVEHDHKDEDKLKKAVPVFQQIQDANDRQWADPYTKSRQLRKRFRHEKKVVAARHAEATSIQDRFGLGMEVLPATAEDVELAQTIDFTERPSKTRAGERLLLESSSFASSSVAAGSRAGSTVLMRPHDGRSRASSSKTTLSARDVLTTELRKRKLEQALASNGGASTLTSAATLGIVKRRLDAEDVEMPSSIKPAALASLVDYASDTSEDDG